MKTISIPESVTKIGLWAFSDCSSLKTINIPESVTQIGLGAFSNCSSLSECKLLASVTAIENETFCGCTSLTNIVLPNTVTTIGGNYGWGRGAFAGCTALKNVVLPNSLTTITDGTFFDCRSLEGIYIPASVTIIGSVYNNGNGISVFDDCLSLKSIIVEDGNPVFDSRENCNALIETATNTLIQGCNTTVIPSTITKIGSPAFRYCPDLERIHIPKSVTEIESGAFGGYLSLSDIEVEEGNPVYDSRENCHAVIETETNTLIRGCDKTIIPNTVTSISSSAFLRSSFENITIPETVTSIGYGTFAYCTSLTNIVIPEFVTDIDACTFEGCTSLTEITCKAETPPAFYYWSEVDEDVSRITLRVPEQSVDVYKAHRTWGRLNVVGYDPTGIENVKSDAAISSIYTLNGKKVNKTIPGEMYIFRHADGKSYKRMVK